jgi:hypothetical protein
MLTLPLHRLTSFSLLAGAALLTGCTAENAPNHGELVSYAEGVYSHYEAAAGGLIAIDVTPMETGNLEDIASVGVEKLLGVPETWIRMDQLGTAITAIHREPRDLAQDEWQQRVDLRAFEGLGHPLAEGTYRMLAVTTTVDGVAATHRALEACWTKSGHCIVMDPVLLQADAFRHTRERLLAEGWEATEVAEAEAQDGKQQPAAVTAAGACTLNAYPGYTRVSITYPAWWVEYKNIFGIVLVRKDMGGQQAGVTCFVNGAGQCVSTGFGYSNASSCFANLGYTCDCENTGNQIGTAADGSSTRSWAESRCAHQAFLSANVSWTIEGVGSGFNVQWQTSGSVDSNGGQIFDSCSFK